MRPDLPILHGVSVHVDAGEVVSIIGPNGAGKSTLVKAIAGTDASVGRQTFGLTAVTSLALLHTSWPPRGWATFLRPGMSLQP